MKTTTVKTTNELLALRDTNDIIRTDGNLIIECDVPHLAGKGIAGIDAVGFLHCKGDLHCGGDLYCRRGLYCKKNLCCKGKYLIVSGDLFWSHSAMPSLPEKRYVNRVLPLEWQRQHWQERLGIYFPKGCYDEIRKHLPALLDNDKWSSTERWMLETLRDSQEKPPQWVVDVQEAS